MAPPKVTDKSASSVNSEVQLIIDRFADTLKKAKNTITSELKPDNSDSANQSTTNETSTGGLTKEDEKSFLQHFGKFFLNLRDRYVKVRADDLRACFENFTADPVCLSNTGVMSADYALEIFARHFPGYQNLTKAEKEVFAERWSTYKEILRDYKQQQDQELLFNLLTLGLASPRARIRPGPLRPDPLVYPSEIYVEPTSVKTVEHGLRSGQPVSGRRLLSPPAELKTGEIQPGKLPGSPGNTVRETPKDIPVAPETPTRLSPPSQQVAETTMQVETLGNQAKNPVELADQTPQQSFWYPPEHPSTLMGPGRPGDLTRDVNPHRTHFFGNNTLHGEIREPVRPDLRYVAGISNNDDDDSGIAPYQKRFMTIETAAKQLQPALMLFRELGMNPEIEQMFSTLAEGNAMMPDAVLKTLVPDSHFEEIRKYIGLYHDIRGPLGFSYDGGHQNHLIDTLGMMIARRDNPELVAELQRNYPALFEAFPHLTATDKPELKDLNRAVRGVRLDFQDYGKVSPYFAQASEAVDKEFGRVMDRLSDRDVRQMAGYANTFFKLIGMHQENDAYMSSGVKTFANRDIHYPEWLGELVSSLQGVKHPENAPRLLYTKPISGNPNYSKAEETAPSLTPDEVLTRKRWMDLDNIMDLAGTNYDRIVKEIATRADAIILTPKVISTDIAADSTTVPVDNGNLALALSRESFDLVLDRIAPQGVNAPPIKTGFLSEQSLTEYAKDLFTRCQNWPAVNNEYRNMTFDFLPEEVQDYFKAFITASFDTMALEGIVELTPEAIMSDSELVQEYESHRHINSLLEEAGQEWQDLIDSIPERALARTKVSDATLYPMSGNYSRNDTTLLAEKAVRKILSDLAPWGSSVLPVQAAPLTEQTLTEYAEALYTGSRSWGRSSRMEYLNKSYSSLSPEEQSFFRNYISEAFIVLVEKGLIQLTSQDAKAALPIDFNPAGLPEPTFEQVESMVQQVAEEAFGPMDRIPQELRGLVLEPSKLTLNLITNQIKEGRPLDDAFIDDIAETLQLMALNVFAPTLEEMPHDIPQEMLERLDRPFGELGLQDQERLRDIVRIAIKAFRENMMH